MLPMFHMYSAICGVLETDGRITEAISFFQRMQREFALDTCIDNEEDKWEQSELYRMDTAGDRLNITQVFGSDAKID